MLICRIMHEAIFIIIGHTFHFSNVKIPKSIQSAICILFIKKTRVIRNTYYIHIVQPDIKTFA